LSKTHEFLVTHVRHSLRPDDESYGLTACFQTQNSDDPFPTTAQDLAGFWDLIMIQVDDVKGLFVEIDSLKNNGWKEIRPETVC
jgi:Guanylate-kinase-associated protein (GKAP) protein